MWSRVRESLSFVNQICAAGNGDLLKPSGHFFTKHLKDIIPIFFPYIGSNKEVVAIIADLVDDIVCGICIVGHILQSCMLQAGIANEIVILEFPILWTANKPSLIAEKGV